MKRSSNWNPFGDSIGLDRFANRRQFWKQEKNPKRKINGGIITAFVVAFISKSLNRGLTQAATWRLIFLTPWGEGGVSILSSSPSSSSSSSSLFRKFSNDPSDWSRWSVDWIWMFEQLCYFHLRWSCFINFSIYTI